jgi:2-polyprenyl-3-methyl-5-hydroxy-6-metoxy-1,4-benzoquinol methylase
MSKNNVPKRAFWLAEITDDSGYNQIYMDSKSMRLRSERRCEYINSRITPLNDGRILEIGCGSGEISYKLASRTKNYILAIDLCFPFIEKAKQKYFLSNLEYKVMDFNDKNALSGISYGEKFNFVYGNGILHHFYYCLDDSLRNIASLLKRGGRIVFLEPNILNPYCFLVFNFGIFRKIAKLEPSEMAFTKGFITRKLKAAGFAGIEVEYRDFLLPGIPDFMIKPSVIAGMVLEKIPPLNMLSQSIYISAFKA